MDFFAQQETARQRTLRLVLLFLAAVIAVIAAVDLTVMLGAWWFLGMPGLPKECHQGLIAVVVAAIVIFAVRRLIKLRGGGEAIATMVSARQVKRNATDLDERRLLNVVDEMAIASGVAVPSVWVMDKEEGINAFAAGYSPNQAVIVVTKGTLTKLNRDELQGVIGHEFSHILNGDMRLNLRLIGLINGILCLAIVGRILLRTGSRGLGKKNNPLPLLGLALLAIGGIGGLFGELIKRAGSRQR